MIPFLKTKNEVELDDISSSCIPESSKVLDKPGGILFLEVLELKEELAMEKEELDYLHKQMRKIIETRNELRSKKREMKGDVILQFAVHQLQQLCQELDEEIDMHICETEMVQALSHELQQELLDKERQSTHCVTPSPTNLRCLRRMKRTNSAHFWNKDEWTFYTTAET